MLFVLSQLRRGSRLDGRCEYPWSKSSARSGVVGICMIPESKHGIATSITNVCDVRTEASLSAALSCIMGCGVFEGHDWSNSPARGSSDWQSRTTAIWTIVAWYMRHFREEISLLLGPGCNYSVIQRAWL